MAAISRIIALSGLLVVLPPAGALAAPTSPPWSGAMWMDLPRGDQGQYHATLGATDDGDVILDVPLLRDLHQTLGLELTQWRTWWRRSSAGAGETHRALTESAAAASAWVRGHWSSLVPEER
ncbi:hypothetical protein HPC49_40455 [Pyxidicoccus fallax]|uniref:Uncharacterized protein n=1 Tax=Pyxidicoccus fallax TaxID=394095 RepID=A0A848LIN8_9BACT|nr:hypothetical protein [Pyxidicoccus fallax]NMO17582.1 hypothetical protein [Pyxidicoccus fallax]NPC84473.1 hypothetical protein [Pyxidicoccus fallax]